MVPAAAASGKNAEKRPTERVEARQRGKPDQAAKLSMGENPRVEGLA